MFDKVFAAPHEYKKLLGYDVRSMVVLGAGGSFKLVPLPSELLTSKKNAAERNLNIDAIEVDLSAPDALYVWAEQAIEQLLLRGEKYPKLRLAEALGILEEPRWTAKVGLPLRGTLPRHRVLARLAKEKRLTSLWSLNWDVHFEHALERIGLRPDIPIAGQPWTSAYKSVIKPDDIPYLAKNQFFCVLKPHGCVRALLSSRELEQNGNLVEAEKLSSRFMITKKELTDERDNETDKKFFKRFRAQISEEPMLVVGWSISEPYLIDVLNDELTDYVKCAGPEMLTILDVYFNDSGHRKAAEIYQVSKENCFQKLGTEWGTLTCDELFLWLQFRYGMNKLVQVSEGETEKKLQHFVDQFSAPQVNRQLFDWFDSFLPSWIRLCWRSGVVPTERFEPHKLRMELEDEYVPLDLGPMARPDIRAATKIFVAVADDMDRFRFDMFPGGLFEEETGRLVLPMPGWGEVNDLAGVKPLLRVVEREIAYVRRIDLLMVPSGLYDFDGQRLSEMKALISAQMRVYRFAEPEHIGDALDLASKWEVN